jgi:hypothetical protein
MNIEIIQILDRGVANKERLWLRVLTDTDLSFFMIFSTKYSTTSLVSNNAKYTHWFASQKVKSGDYIILYTGHGISSESKNNDGSTNHFLYWGIDQTIWNNVGDCAILFEIANWQTSKYE